MSAIAHYSIPAPHISGNRPSVGPPPLCVYIADDHPLILDSIRDVVVIFEPKAMIKTFTDIDLMEQTLATEPHPLLILLDYELLFFPHQSTRQAYHPDLVLTLI